MNRAALLVALGSGAIGVLVGATVVVVVGASDWGTAEGAVVGAGRSGESPLARVLSLAMLGGATSVYLGMARGFDPGPIEAIDRLKAVLRQREP